MPADFNPNSTIAIALKGTDNRAGEHRPVRAEVYGQWAIHVSSGNALLRDPYTVAHIPTGAAVRFGPD